jgi:hypothetical protein
MSCRIEGGGGQAGGHSRGAAVTNDHATSPDKIYSDESTRRNRTGMVTHSANRGADLGGLIQAIVRPRTGG